MTNEQELNFFLFKEEVLKKVQQEVQVTKRYKTYKEFNHNLRVSKKFLDQHDATVVATDKSKRLCVSTVSNMSNRTEAMLNDASVYKPLDKSKKISLEKQANKLIENAFKNKLLKSDYQRLLTTGAQPAKFYTLIKDHKDKNDNDFFPLRPIASVTDTPVNKVDWICGRILNQLVQFVQAHLRSSLNLIADLSKLPTKDLGDNSLFISLDVVNLYPSVPIKSAIEVVSNFTNTHWSKIDNMGISIDQFIKMLNFVSYNYEIQFNGKVFLQVKGCPMGSHYAPPHSLSSL